MPHSPKITSVDALPASEAKWLEFQKLSWTDQTGKPRIWEAASRKTRGSSGVDAVAIAALITHPSRAPSTIVILQYRPPVDAVCVEFPAGLVDEGETPEQAAIRELKEETGYEGKDVELSPVIMGGHAFPHLPTPRLPPSTYHTLRIQTTNLLRTLFTHVTVPTEMPGKPSHGDIDFLAAGYLPLPAGAPLSYDTMLEGAKEKLGAREGRRGAGGVMYFAVRGEGSLEGEMGEVGEELDEEWWVQVDIKVVDALDAQAFAWAKFILDYASGMKILEWDEDTAGPTPRIVFEADTTAPTTAIPAPPTPPASRSTSPSGDPQKTYPPHPNTPERTNPPLHLPSLPQTPPLPFTPRPPPPNMSPEAKLTCLARWTRFSPLQEPYLLLAPREKGFELRWSESGVQERLLVEWVRGMWGKVWVRQGAANWVGMWRRRFEKEGEKRRVEEGKRREEEMKERKKEEEMNERREKILESLRRVNSM
ncbi:hypothetical protein GRF29_19g3276939 [Pseudopithomyces chartarum]|uniref:Nudix hydrolase domain-containing protein n=1 Tax=Pseudopithomyces chartarum TaxID=1892770 RepID=A0AAN6RM32_9PLEO|nr:hypothetical protein GRF29_19g3276939 [Pseudopithomyces chartarum]